MIKKMELENEEGILETEEITEVIEKNIDDVTETEVEEINLEI